MEEQELITQGELIYYAHDLDPAFTELLIPPISDVHYGNPLFSKKHLMWTLKFLEKPNAYSFLNGDLCLSPYTKVLRSNLTYDRLGNIEIGDELVGISENVQPRGRKVLLTTVIGIGRRYAETFRIDLENGVQLIATPEHSWLTRVEKSYPPKSRWEWKETGSLAIGDNLLEVFPVWDTEDNWVSGYIAGLLDGEGSICLRKGKDWRARQLSFSQQEGLVLSFYEDYLRKNDIHYNKSKTTPIGRRKDTFSIQVHTDAPKLFGMTRPIRLAPKMGEFIQKTLTKGLSCKIINIEPYGRKEVVTIETDKHTFIAEGMATHNCESTLKSSKGEIFRQVGSPEDQRDAVSEILYPYRHKLLGAVDGNHEIRIWHEGGIHIVRDIAKNLGIPYRSEGMLHKLSFGNAEGSHSRPAGRPWVFWFYQTHGFGGARTSGAKAVKVERTSHMIHADFYAMSHDHVVNIAPTVYLLPDPRTRAEKNSKGEETGFRVGRVVAHRKMLIKTNAYLKWGGYSEFGGFSPSDLETPLIELLTPQSPRWAELPDKPKQAVKVTA